MPAENYANNASTTVATSSVTAAVGNITVAATSTFPATGQFRVLMESELALATVVNATTLNLIVRGVEGTTAATHAVGVTVEQVLTRESLLLSRALWTDLVLSEDFVSSGVTTGQIGNLGMASTGTPSFIASVLSHPGIIRFDTTTTISTQRVLQLRTDTQPFVSTELWDVTWIVRPVQADGSCVLRIGVCTTPGTSGSDEGAYFLKAATDTAWQMFSVRGGVGTTQLAYSGPTTAITANAWYRLRVRNISSTQLGFTVNDDVEQLWSPANTPTGALQVVPFLQLTNSTAVTEQIDVDYFSLRLTGLSR